MTTTPDAAISRPSGPAAPGLGPLSARSRSRSNRRRGGRRPAVIIFSDGTGHADRSRSSRHRRRGLARLPQPAHRDPERRAAPTDRAGAGRPKLGVVAREVTLLPRHWDWLDAQPGGASVALRKLVEEARRATGDADRARAARDAAYHFMSAMAGNLPTFEEASRALFAGDRRRLAALIAPGPTISATTSSSSPSAIAPNRRSPTGPPGRISKRFHPPPLHNIMNIIILWTGRTGCAKMSQTACNRSARESAVESKSAIPVRFRQPQRLSQP